MLFVNSQSKQVFGIVGSSTSRRSSSGIKSPTRAQFDHGNSDVRAGNSPSRLLYQIEITGDASVAAVQLFLSHFEGSAEAKKFARRLVSGVVSQRVEIDRLIQQCTEHWKLLRMAKVDLVILRMATYELVFCPDIPLNARFG